MCEHPPPGTARAVATTRPGPGEPFVIPSQIVPTQPSVSPHAIPGAEQTEKADAPREPPSVELKPDPTSGMAAAEAEAALSESSEQGTLLPARLASPARSSGPLSCLS